MYLDIALKIQRHFRFPSTEPSGIAFVYCRQGDKHRKMVAR